jgi:sorting nexin-4
MVEKRKRMLQTFLNRVAKHPELSQDHVFHRFLESGVVWVNIKYTRIDGQHVVINDI